MSSSESTSVRNGEPVDVLDLVEGDMVRVRYELKHAASGGEMYRACRVVRVECDDGEKRSEGDGPEDSWALFNPTKCRYKQFFIGARGEDKTVYAEANQQVSGVLKKDIERLSRGESAREEP